MSIETRQGKARPTLPRSDDLKAAAPPAVGATKAELSTTVKRTLKKVDDAEVKALVQDAQALFKAQLAELPYAGPQVIDLAQKRALWSVLSDYLVLHAAAEGLTSDAGMKLLERALKLDQRAERLAVTGLDMGTRLARREQPIEAVGFTWEANGCEAPEPGCEDSGTVKKP